MNEAINAKRFVWRAAGKSGLELFDTTMGRQIAVITGEGHYYQWTRKTSQLLHGAPPASGEESTLLRAKIAVVKGLPD
ncbi:hypothetical protein [Anatilimnocola floriformis]|uniref:hypothetical protein n=1 Tax=Anatilimnocola floriformis TaxID=2948575 RepID=UPI0020C556C2|nr:hypothetical protein [Anatilimnocola floriformis]